MRRVWAAAMMASMPAASAGPAGDAAPATSAPVTAAPADRAAVVEGVNGFTIDLYRRLATTPGNLFVSPASVSAAMTLAYRGANGATAAEMRAAMRFPAAPGAQASAMRALLREWNVSGPGRELRAANALWAQRGLPIRADYLRDIGEAVRPVDFQRDPQAARRTINGWVEGETRDRIRDLLSPRDVSADTRLVLVNAVYWKGAWARPFEPGATREEAFDLGGGRRVSAPLMHQRAGFRVVERRGAQAISLPHAGGEVDMVVLLPRPPDGLPALERSLDARALEGWLRALDGVPERETVLTLPRMRLRWRGNLVPALRSLGVRAAFTEGADFSGLSDAARLQIGGVIHQSFVEVDEAGSQAAAATAVNIVVTGARVGPPPVVFRADRPFLFLLRHRPSGAVLFMGRYAGPEA